MDSRDSQKIVDVDVLNEYIGDLNVDFAGEGVVDREGGALLMDL